jgi:hypothetical protein
MSVETYFEEAGFAAQTVASVAESWIWLEVNTADVAVVDFMLNDVQQPHHPFRHLCWRYSALKRFWDQCRA